MRNGAGAQGGGGGGGMFVRVVDKIQNDAVVV